MNENAFTLPLTSIEPVNLEPIAEPVAPVVIKKEAESKVSDQDLTLHMQLAVDQLETTVLMLQVLDQADGGIAPTE